MYKKIGTLIISTIVATFTMAQDKFERPESYNYLRGIEAMQEEKLGEAIGYFNKVIEEEPKNGYAFSWIAYIKIQQNKLGDALNASNKSLKNLPKDDIEYVYFAYETRGKIYLELGDTLKSLNDYTSAININPENESSYQKRANIYFNMGKYNLAESDYKKMISINQGGGMGYMGLGRIYNELEQWDKAIDKFDYVVKLHPDFSYAYSFRAESYIGKKDWDRATDDILYALLIDDNNIAYYMLKDLEGDAFVKMKTKLEIQMAKEPNKASWPYYLGTMHEEILMYEKAIKYYETANEKDYSATFCERIANCYDEMGNYEDALSYLDNALNIEPENLSVLSLKANTLYEIGKIDDAIVQWNAILDKNPDYGWGYYRRGWFKEINEDIEGAIDDYSISLTLDPKYTYSYVSRAKMYDKLGKKEQAKADYEKVIEIENKPENYNVIHYAYYGLGKIEKAIEAMDSIIKLNKDDPGTYYDAACLYSLMNRSTEALEYLEKCLSMGFARFSHINKDKDLDNIRNLPKFKELIAKYQQEKQNTVKIKEAKGLSRKTKTENIVEIPFTKAEGNGLCNIKCSINELPLHFIFDTGASNVSLSQIEATFMMKNGYLNEKDVVGQSYFMDATGNINVGTVINLRNVDFGGLKLTNVKASVVKNQQAPLLLGQSILGRLGRIEIDNSRNILKIFQK